MNGFKPGDDVSKMDQGWAETILGMIRDQKTLITLLLEHGAALDYDPDPLNPFGVLPPPYFYVTTPEIKQFLVEECGLDVEEMEDVWDGHPQLRPPLRR